MFKFKPILKRKAKALEMRELDESLTLFFLFSICSDGTRREHAVGGLTTKNGKSWLLIAYRLIPYFKVVFGSVLTRIGSNP